MYAPSTCPQPPQPAWQTSPSGRPAAQPQCRRGLARAWWPSSGTLPPQWAPPPVQRASASPRQDLHTRANARHTQAGASAGWWGEGGQQRGDGVGWAARCALPAPGKHPSRLDRSPTSPAMPCPTASPTPVDSCTTEDTPARRDESNRSPSSEKMRGRVPACTHAAPAARSSVRGRRARPGAPTTGGRRTPPLWPPSSHLPARCQSAGAAGTAASTLERKR